MTKPKAKPERPTPTMPPHLSVSAAEAWDTCNRKWHGKYVVGVPDPSGHEADVGKMAHRVLEYLGALPPGMRTPEIARHVALRLWINVPIETYREAMGHVIRALRNLEVSAGDSIAVEMELTTVLSGVPFLGYLDRADALPSGAARISDYKTGKRPGRPDWLDPKKRQVAIYAAAFEVLTGRPVHEGAIVWTVDGHVDLFDLDDEMLSDSLRWFRSQWDGIATAVETDTFAATPNPLCSWCPMAMTCPEGQQAILARRDDGKSIGPHGEAFLAAYQAG